MSGDSASVGPVRVVIDAAEVEAYARASALPGEPFDPATVPATFPAVWLWHPAVREAMAAVVVSTDAVPVLVAQRFDYFATLTVGQACVFHVERQMQADGVFRILARVCAEDGERLAEFAATYRLFSLTEAAA